MTDKRKPPVRHNSVTTHILERQLQRDFPPARSLKCDTAAADMSLSAKLFAHIKQLNLCKSYCILRIHPVVALSVHHC